MNFIKLVHLLLKFSLDLVLDLASTQRHPRLPLGWRAKQSPVSFIIAGYFGFKWHSRVSLKQSWLVRAVAAFTINPTDVARHQWQHLLVVVHLFFSPVI